MELAIFPVLGVPACLLPVDDTHNLPRACSVTYQYIAECEITMSEIDIAIVGKHIKDFLIDVWDNHFRAGLLTRSHSEKPIVKSRDCFERSAFTVQDEVFVRDRAASD